MIAKCGRKVYCIVLYYSTGSNSFAFLYFVRYMQTYSTHLFQARKIS